MNKQCFRQYIGLVQEIEQLEAERERILARLQQPPLADGMPHGQGGCSDPVGNAASRLGDIAAIINEKLDAIIDMRVGIEQAIEALAPEERVLMRLRYLEGLTWPRVTERLYGDRFDFIDHFDSYLRQVHRRHGRILQR